jgi:NAD(P)-dependent dehydrogenase (short-subunit alcohol dehydrogenase family)
MVERNEPGASVAIVTGAGSGIGRATALGLADQGYSVVLNGRTLAALKATAARMPEGKACIVAGDISNLDMPKRLVDAALSHFGRLDAIVNNAGVASRVAIDSVDIATLQDVFATNTFGPALLIARAWPVFRSQKRGVVVNISSLAAVDPFAGYFVYAASKSALDSLARSIAKDGAQWGIEGYSLQAGAVETPLLRRLFDEQAMPGAMAMAPEEVAQVVIECIRGDRRHQNGGTIQVRK